MFKLKFSTTKNSEFIKSFAKVMQYTDYKGTKLAYDIAKIGRKFDEEAKLCHELYIKLLKNYAKLDEKGEFVLREEERMNPKGEKVTIKVPNTYVIIEEKHADGSWEKASTDFDNTEFEIPCAKIKLSDLEGVGLSPLDLLNLENVITETPLAAVGNGAVPTPLKPNMAAAQGPQPPAAS